MSRTPSVARIGGFATRIRGGTSGACARAREKTQNSRARGARGGRRRYLQTWPGPSAIVVQVVPLGHLAPLPAQGISHERNSGPRAPAMP